MKPIATSSALVIAGLTFLLGLTFVVGLTFIAGLAVDAAWAADAVAPTMPGLGLRGRPFPQTEGPALYEAVCQACHMPEGAGGTGAAAYPALAKNPRLAAKVYPVTMILNGSKAMPSFKSVLTDEQVATLAGYIRTHFGNRYKEQVSVADVQALRK